MKDFRVIKIFSRTRSDMKSHGMVYGEENRGGKTCKVSTQHDGKWKILNDILTFLSVEARQYHTTEIPSCVNIFEFSARYSFCEEWNKKRKNTRNKNKLFPTSANFDLKMFFLLFARANELKNRLSKISLAIPTLRLLSKHFSFFPYVFMVSLTHSESFSFFVLTLKIFLPLRPLPIHLPSFNHPYYSPLRILTFSALRKEECYFRRQIFVSLKIISSER